MLASSRLRRLDGDFNWEWPDLGSGEAGYRCVGIEGWLAKVFQPLAKIGGARFLGKVSILGPRTGETLISRVPKPEESRGRRPLIGRIVGRARVLMDEWESIWPGDRGEENYL